MNLITYNPPSANMAMRAALCLFGRKSANKDGIGMAKIARSVAIWMDALENQSPLELKQNPGMEGSQNLATGTQLRNALTIHHIP